jgi:hypothetical protein
MLNELEWAGLGVVATLVVAFVAQRVGVIQIRWMREAHTLNVLKAAPKIGTTIKIEERRENGPAHSPFYYLRISIYNAGDLAAKQLNGHWKLSCTDTSINQCDVPIAIDFLGSAAHELEPYRLEGVNLWRAMKGEPNHQLRFNVDIQLTYFGLSQNQPDPYIATYRFDQNSRKLIRD